MLLDEWVFCQCFVTVTMCCNNIFIICNHIIVTAICSLEKIACSRRSRIFLKRRPLSCEVPSRRDSVGGGGSSRIFLWSPEGDAIQWGGGSTWDFPLMGPFCIFRLSPPESASGMYSGTSPYGHLTSKKTSPSTVTLAQSQIVFPSANNPLQCGHLSIMVTFAQSRGGP